jgi:group I intron endonuclease
MSHGIVYLLTNTTNGKPYVGQTTMSLGQRGAAHAASATSRGRRTALANALRKHGPDAFTMQPIVSAPDALTLDCLERFWIGVCGSIAPGGYNLTSGGETGKKHTPGSRAAMSAAQFKRFASPDGKAAAGAAQRRRFARPEERKKARDALLRSRTREGLSGGMAETWRRNRTKLVEGMKAAWARTRKARSLPLVATNLATGEQQMFETTYDAAVALGLNRRSLGAAITLPGAKLKRLKGYTFTRP